MSILIDETTPIIVQGMTGAMPQQGVDGFEGGGGLQGPAELERLGRCRGRRRVRVCARRRTGVGLAPGDQADR